MYMDSLETCTVQRKAVRPISVFLVTNVAGGDIDSIQPVTVTYPTILNAYVAFSATENSLNGVADGFGQESS